MFISTSISIHICVLVFFPISLRITSNPRRHRGLERWWLLWGANIAGSPGCRVFGDGLTMCFFLTIKVIPSSWLLQVIIFFGEIEVLVQFWSSLGVRKTHLSSQEESVAMMDAMISLTLESNVIVCADDLPSVVRRKHKDIVPHGYRGFHSHWGTPSYHPFLDGIFHNTNQPFWGYPYFRKPPNAKYMSIFPSCDSGYPDWLENRRKPVWSPF